MRSIRLLVVGATIMTWAGCGGEWEMGSSDPSAEGQDALVAPQVRPDTTRALQAVTIRVPEDSQTIGRAIARAPHGATIRIGAGVYRENLVVAGKEVNIVGSGPRSTTILSASSQAAVTYTSGGGGSLRGLAIQGGDVAIAGVGETGSLPSRLTIDDTTISQTRRGIAGSFTRLKVARTHVFPILTGIYVRQATYLDLTGVSVASGAEIGILVENKTYAPSCELVFNDLAVNGNAQGGLIIEGWSCPVRVNRGNYDNNRIVGIGLLNVRGAIVDGPSTSSTLSRQSDGRWGDGVFLWSSSAVFVHLASNNNARAGLSAFGCKATDNPTYFQILASRLGYNGFDIDLESVLFGGTTPAEGCGAYSTVITNESGNTCPHADGSTSCRAVRSSLEPIPPPAHP